MNDKLGAQRARRRAQSHGREDDHDEQHMHEMEEGERQIEPLEQVGAQGDAVSNVLGILGRLDQDEQATKGR